MNQPRIKLIEGLMERTEQLRAYGANEINLEFNDGRSPFTQLCVIVNEILDALLKNEI